MSAAGLLGVTVSTLGTVAIVDSTVDLVQGKKKKKKKKFNPYEDLSKPLF